MTQFQEWFSTEEEKNPNERCKPSKVRLLINQNNMASQQDDNSREIYQYYIKVDAPHTSQNSVTNISNILRYSSVEEAKQIPKQQQMLLSVDQQQQSSESQHNRTILSPPVHVPALELLPSEEREISQQEETFEEDRASPTIPEQRQRSNAKILNRRSSDYFNNSQQGMEPATSTFHSPHIHPQHITPALTSNAPSQIVRSARSTFARLSYKDTVHYVSNQSVDIGRNSSTSQVHFSVGKNSFVSRKHLRIMPNDGEFELICLGKNGVFVDDVFQRKTDEPLKLAKMYVHLFQHCFQYESHDFNLLYIYRCTFRFPSTNIRILFEMDCEDDVIYSPLKISIPEADNKRSPFPSPTGNTKILSNPKLFKIFFSKIQVQSVQPIAVQQVRGTVSRTIIFTTTTTHFKM